MKYHRLNELLELLLPARQNEPDLNLLQFLQNWRKSQVLTARSTP